MDLIDEVRGGADLPPRPRRRTIRETAHVTQARMARELGVARATLHAWETGVSEPEGANRARYARLLRDLAHASATTPTEETR